MRRSVLFLVGCALSLFIGAVPASADNGPHMAGAGLVADTCAGCHRAHTAKAPYLLKASQEQLCFTCHGSAAGGANNDVEEGVGYSEHNRSTPTGALRGGGFKFALIDSGHPEGEKESRVIPALSAGQPTTSSHSINSSEQIAWGNGEISATPNYGKDIDLSCGNCHDPHGNGQYRILRPMPTDAVERPHGSTEGDIEIPDTTTKTYTTSNYWLPGDESAPQFRYRIAEWCTTCHTRYLAGSGSYKTDSGDAVFTYRHRSFYDEASYPPAGKSRRPDCIQCHVAHGSNASMGERSSAVTFPDGSGAAGPGEGDSRLLRVNNRGTCQLCHEK
jgi:predicted CXXCH cytochrome family protein